MEQPTQFYSAYSETATDDKQIQDFSLWELFAFNEIIVLINPLALLFTIPLEVYEIWNYVNVSNLSEYQITFDTAFVTFSILMCSSSL